MAFQLRLSPARLCVVRNPRPTGWRYVGGTVSKRVRVYWMCPMGRVGGLRQEEQWVGPRPLLDD